MKSVDLTPIGCLKEHSKPDEKFVVDLEVDEVALLRAYLVEYHRLSNSRPLQQRLPCEMTIRFTKESGVSVNGGYPPDDDSEFNLQVHHLIFERRLHVVSGS